MFLFLVFWFFGFLVFWFCFCFFVFILFFSIFFLFFSFFQKKYIYISIYIILINNNKIYKNTGVFTKNLKHPSLDICIAKEGDEFTMEEEEEEEGKSVREEGGGDEMVRVLRGGGVVVAPVSAVKVTRVPVLDEGFFFF